MTSNSEEKPNQSTEEKAPDPYNDVSAAWLLLYRAISQSLANADYDTVIDGSLKVLTNLDSFKTMLLDAYACASAMKGRFDKAMQAAEEMIVRAPTKATGYLRAGNTLILQGKHKQAIQVYNRGIEKVSSDDKQHTILKKRKALSQAQIDKRVDFLTLLPPNAANIVIDQLDVTDRDVECMNVSKKWQQMLSDYSLAWKDIMLRSSSDSAVFRLLPTVGRHAEVFGSLGLDKDKSQQMTNSIMSGVFRNVQYFHMHRCEVSQQQLLLILTELGNMLTKLMLDIRKSSLGHPIETILRICPKLETFRYFIGEGDMEYGDLGASANMCKIKSLLLIADVVKTEVLDATLRRCPQLQELCVKLCPPDGLHSIVTHCPNLELLGFNGIRPDLVSPPKVNVPGLRQFTLHRTVGMDPAHLIQILEKSPSALQSFVFSVFDNGPSITERWDRLTKIKFENLRHVSYCFSNSMDMHATVGKMIRNSKALQSVSLRSLENLTGSEFEEALLALPDLAVLKLLVIRKMNVVGLNRFLTTHARKGKASSLKKVHINQCDDFSDSLLEMLATVQTIEEFAMYSCNGPTTFGLVKFIKTISLTNVLDNLHLSDMDAVNDTVLHSIHDIHSLRRLGLVRLSGITVKAVQDLAASMKSLNELNILGCSQISMQASHQIMERFNFRNRVRAIT
ncbi:hypothetical protein BJV82DRAFT_81852 [Fennellomyces sp. T-0311]|nr:hypothetical protein BJV82DRAFT_81852 [Fennellomyces sp. T-0311]